MKTVNRILNPGRAWTAFPFFFLNADLTHEGIRQRMRDYNEHGIHGVVLHPRMGMSRRIGYLSETFFHYIRTAVEEAERLDMQVILYDEGMYPSGSASGQVVEGHPEFMSRGLARVETPREEDTVVARCDPWCLVSRPSLGTIRGVHFGEDDGEAHAPLSADILNPEAVERFLKLTHDAYYARLAPWFGKVIIGFFTDEPSILGRNVWNMFPWSLGFEDLFRKEGGRPEGLAALFEGEENEDTRLYHRLILRREEEVYYHALSAWCEGHGISLMGHPHQSDDMEVEKHFHVPGQDLVLRWIAPETGDLKGMDSVMGKCSADAAYVFSRRRNANEVFGACNRRDNPWSLSGGDMKWYLDYLAVRGVNLFIPHAFYYSIAGQRSMERPPDVGPWNIYWDHYRRWSDYMKRLSFLMTDQKLHAGIAVLCENRDLHPEWVAPLFESQKGFRYLPRSVWHELREEEGKLHFREEVFDCVLGDPGLFPGVSGDAERVEADVQLLEPRKDLRVRRFEKEGKTMLFLVNAGEDMEVHLRLPFRKAVCVDLWRGRSWRAASDGKVCLQLGRRASLLILEGEEAPEEKEARMIHPAFRKTGEDSRSFTRFYEACVESEGNEDLLLEAEGEEMSVLQVNGREADCAFWRGDVMRIPASLLRRGNNELHLEVRGSLCNRYGYPAPYGLPEDWKKKE